MGLQAQLDQLTAEAGDEPGRTRRIRVGAGVLERAASELGGAGPVRVVCDPNTLEAAGRRLAAGIADVQTLVIEPQPGHDELVCDDAVIERVRDEIALDPGAQIVAVGAGTVNDIVKMATAQLERPYTAVATAASMNGYTSAIAAVLSRGIKRTLPAQQPTAVFADVEVIRRAPARLNLAGFGDLLSKPYSNADWLLSHWVRGAPYHSRPAELLDAAYEALLDRAAAIGAAEPGGIEVLTQTILLSGFTMALAGTSAPASGGEHLVSHYWDMEQHCRGQPLRGLHGTQVGIATLLSGLMFERLIALDATQIHPEAAAARRPGPPSVAATDHPNLTAAVVAEIEEQFCAKQRHGAALAEELASVKRRWPDITAALEGALVPADRIARALGEAGAADRPSALAVGGEHCAHTLTMCRQIRSRYVALDLIDDLGYLETWAHEVVARVEAAPTRSP